MCPECYNVGTRIQVGPRHWCRSNQQGVITEVVGQRYLIHFDKHGTGFNDGTCLILGEHDFEVLGAPKPVRKLRSPKIRAG